MNSEVIPSNCPCGSSRGLSDCCGPYLDGLSMPPTAEALMRSRYSAYVLHRVDYLSETLATEAQEGYDAAQTEKWAKSSSWHGLEVRSVEAGGPDDDSGTVEFLAAYAMDGKSYRHHETSRFIRRDGRWFYLDGTVGAPVRKGPKVGRNDPCPCGSGKKYKKCHGI